MRISLPLAAALLTVVLFPRILPKTAAKVHAEEAFRHVVIDGSSYGAVAIGDIDGDGLNDIVVIAHEKSGDVLTWYKYPRWTKHAPLRLDSFKDFKIYRADHMVVADIDRDGDLDVIGRMGVGDEEGIVVWFENPRPSGDPATVAWKRHAVGPTTYAKMFAVADFDRDGKLDIVTRAHEKLSIDFQRTNDRWERLDIAIKRLDGLAVGDLNGDGRPDVILNGYWLECPRRPLRDKWAEHAIDSKWWTMNTPHWSDNNARVAAADINGDGRVDVIIANAEQKGFPVSWYEAPADPQTGPWKEHVVGQIDYCHTLLVVDWDNDGQPDIVAAELPRYDAPYPVVVFRNRGRGEAWSIAQLSDEGSYSAVAGDIGNDGDINVVGSRSYDRPPLELWENLASDASRKASAKASIAKSSRQAGRARRAGPAPISK